MYKYMAIMLLLTFVNADIKDFCTNWCDSYNIPVKYVNNWSYVESTHFRFKSPNRYGRFNISYNWLCDYLRWTKQDMPKDWKKYLLRDDYNCFIAIYSWSVYRNLGYSDAEFLNIWLFGESNVVYNGRWSTNYINKILGGAME